MGMQNKICDGHSRMDVIKDEQQLHPTLFWRSAHSLFKSMGQFRLYMGRLESKGHDII